MFKIFNNSYCFMEMRVLILGLDGAGKTQLLYRLKTGTPPESTTPTIVARTEQLDNRMVVPSSVNWLLLMQEYRDVGGQDRVRPLWKFYYQNTELVIFIIDAADHTRLHAAIEEYRKLLQSDELRDTAFLILANKQDLPNALSAERMRAALLQSDVMQVEMVLPLRAETGTYFASLPSELLVETSRYFPRSAGKRITPVSGKWAVFGCSVTLGTGLDQAIAWVVQQLRPDGLPQPPSQLWFWQRWTQSCSLQ